MWQLNVSRDLIFKTWQNVQYSKGLHDLTKVINIDKWLKSVKNLEREGEERKEREKNNREEKRRERREEKRRDLDKMWWVSSVKQCCQSDGSDKWHRLIKTLVSTDAPTSKHIKPITIIGYQTALKFLIDLELMTRRFKAVFWQLPLLHVV